MNWVWKVALVFLLFLPTCDGFLSCAKPPVVRLFDSIEYAAHARTSTTCR